MAVKTRFQSADFERILAQYDLGSYTHAEAIQRGAIQTNYFLNTTYGKFVLRYYETRSTQSVLFESELLSYLAAHQYPCPLQVKNIHGAYVSHYRERPYVVFEFIEGQHIEHPTAFHYQQLIQQAAELQKLTVGYASPYTSQRWNYTPALCHKLAQSEAEKLNTRRARAKLVWLESALTRLALPGTLPQGICHCDFHFSNVLFEGDKFVALLDFDDANYTYLSFDLVGLIERWAWTHREDKLDLEAAREVVQIYMRYRPLGEQERYHLYDVYKLSILMDSVWYFGRWSGDSFYESRKLEFLEDLGRQRFCERLFG
ncbi:MAG: phosphotransferase [Chloroflexi bacterium]|nr:phosphotransferase [Chloroflexota bacterium]